MSNNTNVPGVTKVIIDSGKVHFATNEEGGLVNRVELFRARAEGKHVPTIAFETRDNNGVHHLRIAVEDIGTASMDKLADVFGPALQERPLLPASIMSAIREHLDDTGPRVLMA